MEFFGVFSQILKSFPEAVCSGLLIGSVCSFLGVFVVLKRMVFIGITLLQAAACGIAAAFFFHLNPFFGAVFGSLMTVTILALPSDERRIPRDALMALIFILTSSLSILFVSRSAVGFEEVKELLYGDLILCSPLDFKVLFLTLLPPAFAILILLRPITYTFLDREEALVLGVRVRFWELLFFYASALVISSASKLGGMVLVFCYLVIPSMAGLVLCTRLKHVFLIAQITALISTLAGFYISYAYDLPVNPCIAAAGTVTLLIIYILNYFINRVK